MYSIQAGIGVIKLGSLLFSLSNPIPLSVYLDICILDVFRICSRELSAPD